MKKALFVFIAVNLILFCLLLGCGINTAEAQFPKPTVKYIKTATPTVDPYLPPEPTLEPTIDITPYPDPGNKDGGVTSVNVMEFTANSNIDIEFVIFVAFAVVCIIVLVVIDYNHGKKYQ